MSSSPFSDRTILPATVLSRRSLFLLVPAVAIAARPETARAYDRTSLRDVNVTSDGLALRGYDPVAYFTEGKAMRGKAEFSAKVDGVTWRFASASHRAMFVKDPQRFSPAYGGFCAMGTAVSRKVDADPRQWTIVEGRLYVNVDKDTADYWKGDIPKHVAEADINWPKVKDMAPKDLP